jgi:hypothetical protein
MMMEAICYPETSGSLGNNPEEPALHTHRCENVNSYRDLSFILLVQTGSEVCPRILVSFKA